ncbi:MAG TPA: hypothetical protein VFR02_08705, partial [bacterium]|nr:hypothetical protein [bacterium]
MAKSARRSLGVPGLPALLTAGLCAWTLFVFIRYFDPGALPGQAAAFFASWAPGRFSEAGWPQHLGVWAESLGLLAVSLLALLNNWWLGAVLLERLGLSRVKSPVRWGLESALGALASSLFWLGLGFSKLWEPAPLIFLGLVAAGPAGWKLRERLRASRPFPAPPGPLLGALTAAALAAWALGFLQAFLPETFYDSLNYFLGVPHFWALRHGVCDEPGQILSGYFHGGTLFLMDGFYFGGAGAAKMLAFFSAFACAAFAGAWAGEEAGVGAGWTAFGLTAAFPLLALNGWAARVDGLLTFCLLAFFYACRKCFPAAAPGWGAAAGLLGGYAVTVKPTALVGIAAVLLCLLPAWRRAPGRAWLTPLALGAGVVAPWLAKNACF